MINAKAKGVNGKRESYFLKKNRLRHAAPAHQSIQPEMTDTRRININPTRKNKRGIAAPLVR
jgi:hypothetical protein